MKRCTRADVTYRYVEEDGRSREGPFVFQTPELTSRFGFNVFSYDGKQDNAKASIDATFSNPDSATLATFRAIDATILEELKKNVDEYFPGKGMEPGLVKHLYGGRDGPIVRVTKREGVEYDPKISLKIQSVEQDGVRVANVICFGPSANKEKPKTVEVDEFGKGCTYRAICTFEGLYVTEKISPVIRADQLQLVNQGKVNGFGFL